MAGRQVKDGYIHVTARPGASPGERTEKKGRRQRRLAGKITPYPIQVRAVHTGGWYRRIDSGHLFVAPRLEKASFLIVPDGRPPGKS